MTSRVPLAVLCLAATAGLLFASVSTIDFVAHLDRQVHELHCSFVPGLVAETEGAEGCKLTLMSPYSSVLRRSQWGGIPISLPAMAVFAFLLFRSIDLWSRPPGQRRTGANILLAGAVVPALASVMMGWIAFTELDAACKLCIGIYASSAVGLVAAVWTKLAIAADPLPFEPPGPPFRPDADAPPDGSPDAPADASPRAPGAAPVDAASSAPESSASVGPLAWVIAAAQLGGFVALPTVAYVAMAPDFSSYIGGCGRLETIDDPYGVLVPLDGNTSGTPTVEVLDPLCPACKAFEERLGASGLEPSLHRVGLLFPLDETCNWMVTRSLHPGACAVSEAILCAHRQNMPVDQVLKWAFAHQAELLAAEKNRPGSTAEHVAKEFGALASCLGSAEVQADLNKSLRWAVAHELPVMTPQLYVGGVKVCDEDTDLGMEWAISQVLEKQASGALPTVHPQPRAASEDAKEGSRPAASAEPARKRGSTPPRAKKRSPAKRPANEEPSADAPSPSKLPSVEEIPPPKEEEQP